MAGLASNLAFVFPGQGSQRVGMFSSDTTPPQVINAVNQASEVLGIDLMELSEDAEEINKTEITQPILICAGVGTYRAYLEAGGIPPTIMAGHSLGEYSALVCASIIDFGTAVLMVNSRGEAMQEAVELGTGGMAAVLGLDEASVAEICNNVDDQVWVANINSPEQIVIAGIKVAVEEAGNLCKDKGAKRVVPLPISIPSHCPLMKPASIFLANMLTDIPFISSDIPIIHNASNEAANSVDEIKTNLIEQLVKPVNWVATVNKIMQSAEQIIECGPNKVLHGLNRRIVDADKCLAIDSHAAIDELLT